MKAKFTFLIKIIFILSFTTVYFNSPAQVSEEWTHRYTGPKASADDPTDVTVDNSGNIYLTGQSIVGGDFFKFITVKFNSSGVRQWVSKYEGLPFSNSIGYSVDVDSYGNVYATGYTRVGSGQIDLLLIKYDQNGTEQWKQQFNGPGNFDDFGVSLDLDTAGNVYVGGYSYGSGTNYDFVLLKYNPAGVNQWTKRWNGVTNGADYLKKINLSSDGNIVVTGYSFKNTTFNDFTTIKYNSSGDLIWMRQYNSSFNSDDQAINLKVDPQNNVYVCGQSKGTGLGYDFAVVKYDSSGNQQWLQRYDSPGSFDDVAKSVDLDINGNVFVTGHTYQPGTLNDFITIKYNSAGIQQWTRFYNADNLSDRGVDVRVDQSGNVYVTGNSIKNGNGSSDIEIIKYDNSGNVVWTKSYNGPGNLDDNPVKLVLNSSQEPVVIGNSYSYFFSILCGSSDYLALRFNPSGDINMETRYDGSGTGTDESVALYADNNGNSYVTGFSYDDNSDYDYATLKYSSSGEPLWAVRYDGGNNGKDKPVSVSADINGNVYVTGSSRGASGNNDILTIKYNSAGTYQWEARYNGASNGDDQATGLAVDASGNSYVTGYSDGSGTGKDYVTLKYSVSGVQQWASRFNGPANSNDYSKAVFIDHSGNSFVTGNAAVSGSSPDIYTVKYNSSGVQQWVAAFNGNGNDSDDVNCITTDYLGNIIIGGKSKSAASDFDFVTVKYNSSGTQQWAKYLSGNSSNSRDEIISIASDLNNNILAGGNAKYQSSGYDYVTVKYNSSGDLLWNSNHGGTSGTDDLMSYLSIDLAGNAYVTGFTNDLFSGMNFCTVKYNINGTQDWEKKYNFIDNDSDKASMVKTDTSGNVYVTGFSKSIESTRDFFTIKYTQSKTLYSKIYIEGLYNGVTDKMIPDTVKLILRNATPPYNAVDSSVSVIDTSGNCLLSFSNVQNGNSFYLVINHRNSIDTWSSSGMKFNANSLYYDFTSSATQAYGNNLKLKGSSYCVYGGDVNKDEIVDLTDIVFIYNKASKFTSGYTIGDLNGDEIVDLTDLIIAYNNSSEFISVISP